MNFTGHPLSEPRASVADVAILTETARWRARDVRYMSGTWPKLRPLVPQFDRAPFACPHDPENPFYDIVVRLPVTTIERPVPVGIVSKTYSLVQHRELADRCVQALSTAGVDASGLRCEIGLSELGEWMNFRIYFPDRYAVDPADGYKVTLRLEAFNSVDGSSRLTILIGWYRFICSNGLVIGRSLVKSSDLHNANLDLPEIIASVESGIRCATAEVQSFRAMEQKPVFIGVLNSWIENTVAREWGKKAACRVHHICTSGHDVEVLTSFEKVSPHKMLVREGQKVPGSPAPAATVYDVCQALSWVASRRGDAEERVDWQKAIPGLLKPLMEFRPKGGGDALLL